MPNPQLAVDWQPERMQFPCIAQPKIDGVRGGQYELGKFTGRSLKAFKNRKLVKYWSDEGFFGIDGELVLPASHPWVHQSMCRDTTSISGTIESPIVLDLVAFDLVVPSLLPRPYEARYERLARVVEMVGKVRDENKLHLMPMEIVRNMDELEELDNKWTAMGYEGTIVRNRKAPFKPDRSGLAMELWRIKRHIDFEMLVTGFDEAMENRNEAKTNALGRTERSSHKDNKHGKSMVGNIHGTIVKAVVHRGKTLFPKGMPVTCGPGQLTHAERAAIFRDPKLLIGKIGKVKTWPTGVKDKPRQPVWLTVRDKVDM